MIKIGQLHTFLQGLNFVAAEQIDSWVDDLQIIPSGRNTGVPGRIIVCENHYTATFFIERYPHGRINESILTASISCWLMENSGDSLDKFEFPIILDVLDAQVANVEFGIPFREFVYAQEDEAGPLVFNSKTYSLI
ncbi:phage tail protein [Methylovulum psychrotolerans]|uniref:Phage tail protein n=1 Tax=Methylovulum psychrotolerans TaxID=1704499 RepID=A0A2S5CGG7_9GAMM|nr:phage tail protein [Methylovulum psychrotolerans]POZ49898.1 hypothetical protein AADEFJLK_04344 [Methylovulum psychrotolerans]